MIESRDRRHCFVVLAHGDSPYLEECIGSLLAQSQPSRIVIATSTPSRFQRELADKYDIRYVVNPEGGNIAADWNFAFEATDGTYLTLAHQDDIYDREYARIMIETLTSHPDALMAHSDYAILADTGVRNWSTLLAFKRALIQVLSLGKTRVSGRGKQALVCLGNPICCPSVTYNRSRIANLAFDPSFGVNLDWKYWIDLAAREGSFIYVKQRLLYYRAHQGTTTRKAIHSGARAETDRDCFRLLWPTPIASILAHVYRLSYRSSK
jgi:glycosyltransferase involved in cell wall biosynthesis